MSREQNQADNRENPPTWTALVVTTAVTSAIAFMAGFLSGHLAGAMMMLKSLADK